MQTFKSFLVENTQHIKIYTPRQLLDKLYKNGDAKKQYLDLPDRLKYFSFSGLVHDNMSLYAKYDTYYFIVEIENKIIGSARLQQNPYDKNMFWLTHLTIDEEYRNQGYASKLANEIFKFVKQNDYVLKGSMYSDIGYEKLKPLFNRLAKQYDIKFIDSEERLHDTRPNNIKIPKFKF
jgi:GNAT superfamily N-acetyltransferase